VPSAIPFNKQNPLSLAANPLSLQLSASASAHNELCQQRGASSTSIGPASESRAPKLLHCGLGLLLHHAGKRPFRAPMHTRSGGRSRACPSLSCVCVCVIVEPRQLLPRAWCYRCPRRYLSINKTLSRSTFSSVDAPRRLGLRAQPDRWLDRGARRGRA